MISGKYTLDVYYSYYRKSASYREGKLLFEKPKCELPGMMKKARGDIDTKKYFVKLIANTSKNRKKYLKK